jgi:hypothetical protein
MATAIQYNSKIESKCADGGFENFDLTLGKVTCVLKKDYVKVDTFTFDVIDDKVAEGPVADINCTCRRRGNDF